MLNTRTAPENSAGEEDGTTQKKSKAYIFNGAFLNNWGAAKIPKALPYFFLDKATMMFRYKKFMNTAHKNFSPIL